MDITIIKNEIKWQLEAIHEEFEAIHRYEGKIPQIEFDILMDNVRKFYENIRLLQRLNEPVIIPERTAAPPPVPVSPTVAPPATIKSGVTVRFEEQPSHAPLSNELPEKQAVIPPPSPVQFKPVASPPARSEPLPQSKKPARAPVPDLFAVEEPAFSIKLKTAHEKNFSQKPPSRHIENLKAAISINDKFMFINELFDGNLREYNETIETLNGFKDFNQAADYLDLMRKKNFWNTGSPAFKKLSELVEQKF